MIEANKNELFPVTVSLVDDATAELVPGKVVLFDVRFVDDTPLSPPVSGSLSESTVVSGIYKKEISLPESGSFICYATCSGFLTSTEDILINEYNLVEVSKYSLPQNISVIDIPRTTSSGSATASQIARNVPVGKTDYITTLIKRDSDIDWSDPVSSGTSYAHYVSTGSVLPFMMGGPL